MNNECSTIVVPSSTMFKVFPLLVDACITTGHYTHSPHTNSRVPGPRLTYLFVVQEFLLYH